MRTLPILLGVQSLWSTKCIFTHLRVLILSIDVVHTIITQFKLLHVHLFPDTI